MNTFKKIFMFVNVDWFFYSHRLPIAKEASLNNVNMSVYADISNKSFERDKKDFEVFQSPLTRTSNGILKSFYELTRVLLLIVREKPDLIHAVTIKPIIFLGLVSRLTNTPFIGAISGMGPIINYTSLYQRLRFKVVLIIYRIIFKPQTSLIICQNEFDKNIILENKVCKQESICIISGSGVNLDKFKPSIERSHDTVLMASRILRDKGVMEYCEAADLYRKKYNDQIKFLLAGPIDEYSPTSISEEEILTLCKKNGVSYLGNRSDLSELLSRATIFVLPSYYQEGIPKVLIEASACGIPIITTDHPGCRDAVIEGKTGLLVEARNNEVIVTALNKLLDNHEYSAEMGRQAHQYAKEKFDEKKVIRQHYSLYHELMN